MKDANASRLVGQVVDPFTFNKPHVGLQLHALSPSCYHRGSDEAASTMQSKSSPMDFVPTSVLKRCSGVFAPLIARLTNMSFIEGRFPAQFKQAQTTPLLKKTGMDVDDPASYRPISNLNTISKVMERLALARLRQQVTQPENFNKSQCAYRQNHSAATALLNIFNDAYGNIDKGQSTLLVALDLSAAFDSVEHSVLLTRLENSFGVTGVAREWIASYVAHRMQFVRVGSEKCAATSCSCGVTQGSVLGPLLFVAYICPV